MGAWAKGNSSMNESMLAFLLHYLKNLEEHLDFRVFHTGGGFSSESSRTWMTNHGGLVTAQIITRAHTYKMGSPAGVPAPGTSDVPMALTDSQLDFILDNSCFTDFTTATSNVDKEKADSLVMSDTEWGCMLRLACSRYESEARSETVEKGEKHLKLHIWLKLYGNLLSSGGNNTALSAIRRQLLDGLDLDRWDIKHPPPGRQNWSSSAT